MNQTWHSHRKNMEDERIQEEIRLAKKIQKDFPDMKWTEALRLARVLLDPIAVI